MGRIYGYSKEMDLTFHYVQPAPLDDRIAVKSVADLSTLTPYVGLMTYVTNDNTYYSYDGTRWNPCNMYDTAGGFIVLGMYQSYELFVALHPTGEEGTAYLIGTEAENVCYIWNVDTGEWLNIGPIRGKQGPIGEKGEAGEAGVSGTLGKSDYEVAVEHGYTGSEEDWITTYFTNAKMFLAIRALQAEVAKLKNSFLFGINSYLELDTASSRVVSGYSTVDDKEPLWAIDEDDLSLISDLEIEFNEYHGLTPAVDTIIDISTEGILGIEDAIWEDSANILKDKSDAKLFVYLAANNKTVTFNLKGLTSESILEIPCENLTNATSVDFYHIMLILSRQYGLKGKRYAYLSIDNNVTGLNIARGYYNPTTLLLLDNACYFDAACNLDDDYYLTSIRFLDLQLTKCRFYSKFLDFSNEVIINDDEIISEAPKELDYKYSAAHITIRGVKDYSTMSSIKDQLKKFELIWEDDKQELYIKTDKGLIKIGATSTSGGGTSGGGETPPTTDNMTLDEVIEILEALGLIKNDNGHLEINPVADITFINTDTNTKYVASVDAYGNLLTKKEDNSSLADRFDNDRAVLKGLGTRGLLGRIGEIEIKKEQPNLDTSAKNIGLYSDRLKIGAFYMPLDTDTVYGCSHCYIELENTSDKDIPLKNFYLHYCFPFDNGDKSYTLTVRHLALTGTIKAGGTYLIRGAAKTKSVNTFINVDTYDLEWYYNKELLDFTVVKSIVTDSSSAYGYGLALTYWDEEMSQIPATETTEGGTSKQINTIRVKDITPSTVLYSSSSYYGGFIDAINIGKPWTGDLWASATSMPITSNCICKNTYELDPANLAYQSLHAKDSSRVRWANVSDYLNLILNKEYIEFPKSEEKYPVSYFTPKASFEDKTVCTDKSKFNLDKPNMTTVSFGIDIHTTRCFNWLSAGLFDEYVWIRKLGTTTWSKFQSYKEMSTVTTATALPSNTSTITYTEETTTPSTGAMTRKEYHTVHTITSTKIEEGKTTVSIYLKENIDPKDIVNRVYKRKTATFPGNGTMYTSHKCIVLILSSAPSEPEIYEYVVGRENKLGNPDENHTSAILTFTIYPSTYIPRIYQITDQQGFTWLEYQAWAAAAKAVNARILEDLSTNNIIPILINTGDMTQNGTRINEWLDYYNAGQCLFNHLELMNVVGNNDLCNSVDGVDKITGKTIPSYELLGTGDDAGKSSPYYFNISYCYEVDNSNVEISYEEDNGEVNSSTIDITPIVNGVYIPSLYYFGNSKYFYLMINSELTEKACRYLYNLSAGTDFYNIYTGCKVNASSTSTWEATTWTPVYSLLYGILKTKATGKTVCIACHEMPFTVITSDNVKSSTITASRGFDSKNGLVGSHLCLIVNGESGDGTYWAARLFEFFNIKLCIGGHKHTYACTLPVRENYIYNGTSSKTEIMKMKPTLESDKYISWLGSETVSTSDTASSTIASCHLSKFPLIKASSYNSIIANQDSFLPGILQSDLTGGVIYFMCLATGYKRQSNKELPTCTLIFDYLVPQTNDAAATAGKKVNANLKYAMFAIITLGVGTFKIELARIKGIFDASYNFTQTSYGTTSLDYEYIHPVSGSIYGKWEGKKDNNYIVII